MTSRISEARLHEEPKIRAVAGSRLSLIPGTRIIGASSAYAPAIARAGRRGGRREGRSTGAECGGEPKHVAAEEVSRAAVYAAAAGRGGRRALLLLLCCWWWCTGDDRSWRYRGLGPSATTTDGRDLRQPRQQQQQTVRPNDCQSRDHGTHMFFIRSVRCVFVGAFVSGNA